MTYTENYKLNKPDRTDFVNINDLNDNADAIDAQMKANATAISEETTRATAVEKANATAISTEATRAEAAEALKANKADLMSLLFTVVSVIDDDSSTT